MLRGIVTALLVLWLALALWVAIDAVRRRFVPGVFLALGVLLLPPVFAPIYFAVRPLRAGETREGGRWWNLLKDFALAWTLLMALLGVNYIGTLSGVANTPTTDAERAGFGPRTMVGIAFVGALWFLPAAAALVLGFFLRKRSVVERGPTGRFASGAQGSQNG